MPRPPSNLPPGNLPPPPGVLGMAPPPPPRPMYNFMGWICIFFFLFIKYTHGITNILWAKFFLVTCLLHRWRISNFGTHFTLNNWRLAAGSHERKRKMKAMPPLKRDKNGGKNCLFCCRFSFIVVNVSKGEMLTVWRHRIFRSGRGKD